MERRMPEVVVYLLEGRSLEQKRGLVKDITQAVVKNAGTNADQVTVSLVETPRTSKAKGGVLFSVAEPTAIAWVNNFVSALHNSLVAVR
jgi:4-oxalocrotonate tautomerase